MTVSALAMVCAFYDTLIIRKWASKPAVVVVEESVSPQPRSHAQHTLLEAVAAPEAAPVAAPEAVATVSYKTPLAYGTKSLNEETAELVTQAINEGFRHIVTQGHHQNHDEAGVGVGWKASGVDRKELFLQTCFVPFGSKKDFRRDPLDPETLPDAIEDQVLLSFDISLKNLQTDYVDALIFHNFRAKRWSEDEIMKAWKVFETLVDQGKVKHLGMTSIHHADWFEKFYDAVRIKPVIIQNRFHSNRQYDVHMQDAFAKRQIQVQRFWLLNGSSGHGERSNDVAKAKGVTNEQLLLAFVMSLGSQTCLVGTHSQQHMKDDVEISKCYPSLFWGDDNDNSDEQRRTYANKLGMKHPSDQPLPGWEGKEDTGGRTCQSTTMAIHLFPDG